MKKIDKKKGFITILELVVLIVIVVILMVVIILCYPLDGHVIF